MHRRALILISLVWLLAACDPMAISTPTPSPAPPVATAEPTPTTEPTAPPTDVPPTATAGATLPTATAETGALSPTVQAGSPVTATTQLGAPTPTAQASIDPQIEAQLVQIESDTSAMRGLQPKAHVPEKFVPQSVLKANLTDQIKADYKPEDARRDATTLWLLRLLNDPSIDLRQLQIDLLGEQVLGYYDRKKKELYVRSDQAQLSPLSRETLAHEYTHSLQDQYYDLHKLTPDKIENDRGTAVLSLIEGDATISGVAYARQYMTSADFQALMNESNNSPRTVMDAAPRYIRDSLLFPYDQSIPFITALVQAQPGSFKGIDKAFTDPPQSTEQILHPEKYLNQPRDLPVAVTPPPLTSTLGAGWTQSHTDTMGEFDLTEILKINGVADSTADTAAAGWGGGGYALYQNGNAALLILGTVWDTPKDATEFNDALQSSMGSLKKDGTLWTDGKRFFGTAHTTSGVTIVSGTDRGAVQRAIVAK
jgi:hypothetical protein